MARHDHEAVGPIARQEWRGKRQRHEDASEALAHALLETVRQALDEGTAGEPTAGNPPFSQTSHQRDRKAARQLEGGGLGDGGGQPPGGEGHHSDESGQQQDVKSEHGAGWWQARGEEWKAEHGDAARHDDGAAGDVNPGRTHAGRPAAADWILQPPQQARGTASYDSATTTLNTGEGPADGHADDAADPDASTADEGAVGPSRKKSASTKMALPGGPCAHCGTTESPQWRRPLTRKVVLCNACGIYFSRHHSLPKRKKAILRGSYSRQDQAALRKDPAQSIICEEELEADEQLAAQPALPARGPRKLSRAAALRQLKELEQGRVHRSDTGGELAQHEPMAGPDPRPPELPRMALSLPLNTALPVLGGINVIVQSFLSKSFASR